MEQMSPYLTLNEDPMRRIAEHQPSQNQTALSRSPTTRPHERLGTTFHGGVLFDSSSEFLWSSNVQSSTPSNVRSLLKTELCKIRDMTHTPAGGIDEEIDMVSLIRRFARSLFSRRSAVAPISALPPKLLAQIFHFYALEEPPWSGGVQKLGWITVTHVCQRWRQVALGDSSLWARITGSSPNARWIFEMLVRARNAPLVVDSAATPVLGILSKFPQNIIHIRELRLRGLSLLRSQGLREICALEAPALEHFELGVSAPYPVTFHQLGVTTLFRGRAPKLRTLSLSKVSIPWSLIPRGQLTQLKITLIRGISTPSTRSSDQLPDLLINSPNLEILVLEFCLPNSHFLAPDGQTIHLPRLSRLCLGGSTSRVANLLKMLQLPSFTTLRLRCISNPSTDDVNIILPLVSAHFHNHTPVMFRSLRVTINSLIGFVNVAASTAHSKSTMSGLHALEDDTDSDAELTVSFDGLPSLHHSTQGIILEGVFSMLPISNLEFLSISVPAFVPSVNWYELSQRFEKVTTIRASGRGTSGLLQSLAPLKPTKTTSDSKGKKGRWVTKPTRAQGGIKTTAAHPAIKPFPKLTSLFLENLDFGSTTMTQYGALHDVIAYVLRRRRANNTPLNMLRIYRCAFTFDRAKGLKRYVRELRWDGDEGLPFKGWDGDEDFSFDEWDSDESISIDEWLGHEGLSFDEWDGD